MDQQERDEFKRLLHHYEEVLQDPSLTATERTKFKEARDKLADAFLQVWLPSGLMRRGVMLALVASGLYGLFNGYDAPWLE